MRLLVVLCCLFSSSVLADSYVQKSGKILGINSGRSGDPTEARFSIKISGEGTNCEYGSWVVVNKSSFGENSEGYNKFYSVALAAYMAQLETVELFTTSTACETATWIKLN